MNTIYGNIWILVIWVFVINSNYKNATVVSTVIHHTRLMAQTHQEAYLLLMEIENRCSWLVAIQGLCSSSDSFLYLPAWGFRLCFLDTAVREATLKWAGGWLEVLGEIRGKCFRVRNMCVPLDWPFHVCHVILHSSCPVLIYLLIVRVFSLFPGAWGFEEVRICVSNVWFRD